MSRAVLPSAKPKIVKIPPSKYIILWIGRQTLHVPSIPKTFFAIVGSVTLGLPDHAKWAIAGRARPVHGLN